MAKRESGSSTGGGFSGPGDQGRESPAQFIIDQAIGHHQAGQLPEAAALYARAIDLDSSAHVAIAMLGTVALQSGEFERAHEMLQHAIAICPDDANYWFNDGLTLEALGDRAGAEAAVRRSLDLAPNNASALNQLGVFLRDAGRMEEAYAVLSRATRADPNLAEAWINLTSALGDLGRRKDAMTAARKALHRAPEHPRAHYNFGRLHADNENHEDARAAFEEAIRLDQSSADAWASLAKVLIAMNRPIEAESAASKALARDPAHHIGLCNMGLALIRQARYADALPYLREAVELDPLEGTGVSNLACSLLALGKFDEGWPMYEQMLRSDRGRHTVFVQNSQYPVWHGEPLDGKSVLVSAEQGIGEQIMFATMIDRLTGAGARVGYVCDERLVPMIERSMPGVQVFAAQIGDPEPEGFDYFLPVGSLAPRFLHSAADFPRCKGFLSPDEDFTAELRDRYRDGHDGPVIGISWRSASGLVGIQKNAPLALWTPIFNLPGCRFISVQYGDVRDDVAKARKDLGVEIDVDPDVDAMKSIDRNAAQIAACDLIISISNATLHIAGACGGRDTVDRRARPELVLVSGGGPAKPLVSLGKGIPAGGRRRLVTGHKPHHQGCSALSGALVMVIRPRETDKEFRQYANKVVTAFNADLWFCADEYACATCNTYLRRGIYMSDKPVVEMLANIFSSLGSKRNASVIAGLAEKLATSSTGELHPGDEGELFEAMEPLVPEATRAAIRRLGDEADDKYFRRFDFEFYRNARYYTDYVNLDRQVVLDLGAGAGYFACFCQRNGHTVFALDLEGCSPLYDRSFEILGLDKIHFTIQPDEALPPIPEKVDLVTAFQICFNGHGHEDLWGAEAWRSFLRNLGQDILADGGEVILSFNFEYSNPFVSDGGSRFGYREVEDLFSPFLIVGGESRVARLSKSQVEAL